jgi:hypothetical protein
VNDNNAMKEKQALAGKVVGLDLTAFQRQKEITVREEKKKMIVTFVVDNEVDFAFIKVFMLFIIVLCIIVLCMLCIMYVMYYVCYVLCILCILCMLCINPPLSM